MEKHIIHLMTDDGVKSLTTCGKSVRKGRTSYTASPQTATCPDCLNIHYVRERMERNKRHDEELEAERAAHLRTLQALDKKPDAVIHLIKNRYDVNRQTIVPWCETFPTPGSMLSEDLYQVTCPVCLRQLVKDQQEKSDRLNAAHKAYEACVQDQAKKIEALRSTVKHMKRAVELSAGVAIEMCREGD